MLLNSVYFATYLASTSTHPNAFEWDSQSKYKFFSIIKEDSLLRIIAIAHVTHSDLMQWRGDHPGQQ